MPTTLNYDHLHTELNSLMDSLTCDTVKAHEDYEQLYHTIASGQERPDNTTICNILKNVEKTPDDLKNDVAWRIKRSKMIEEYQSIPILQTEHDEAVAEIRRLNAEQEKLEEEYELKKQPYRTKRDQAEWRLRGLRDHRDILIRECRCEALIEGLDYQQFQRGKIAEQHNRLTSEIYRHRRRIADAIDILEGHKRMIYYDNMEARHRAAQQAIRESEVEIVQLQKQVDQLDAKLAEHDAEIARIQEQMLYE